ncbi:hypothetical protein ACA910_020213 [Epithemia clementina (nom. ined.)]
MPLNNPTTQVHNPTTAGPSPDMIFLTEKLSEAVMHQNSMLKAQEDCKDHFKSLPIHTCNSLIYGQVGQNTVSLPSTPSAMAIEIFKQKNTYAFYQTIHTQVFQQTDNNCYIQFGQCRILQKFGPMGKQKSNQMASPPSHLTHITPLGQLTRAQLTTTSTKTCSNVRCARQMASRRKR